MVKKKRRQRAMQEEIPGEYLVRCVETTVTDVTVAAQNRAEAETLARVQCETAHFRTIDRRRTVEVVAKITPI